MGRRPFSGKEVIGYIIAQVVGGIIAAAVLYVVASGKAGFDAAASGFASNGYGEHSPGGFSMLSAIVIEIVLTCGFLLVIHGATDKHAPAGFAPIAIGGADPHPFDQHSSHQHLGQPGAQHRGGNFPGAAGRCSSCGCSGSCQSSAGSSAACCIAPCWKTRLTLFKARVSGLFFFFWRQLYSAGDLGSVMGAILIMQGLHRSCFRDSLLFCCRWSSAIYCLFVTPPR